MLERKNKPSRVQAFIRKKIIVGMYQRHSPGVLRTCRRLAGFTQHELACLLGMESRTQLSRVEREEQMPELEQALRYHYLFGTPFASLVPRLCDRMLNGLWEDIEALLATCDPAKDGKSQRKYDLLCAAKARIEALSL